MLFLYIFTLIWTNEYIYNEYKYVACQLIWTLYCVLTQWMQFPVAEILDVCALIFSKRVNVSILTALFLNNKYENLIQA